MRLFYLLCLLVISGGWIFLSGQTSKSGLVDYLELHRHSFEPGKELIPPEEYRLFFFGSVHGTQLTQDVDLRLLQHLVDNQRVRIYLPEVDGCVAYFLNRFLENGDTSLLKEITVWYKEFVPQDASVQFYEKWRAIYQWNQQKPSSERIKVMGAEPLNSEKLALRTLRELHHHAVRSSRLIRPILKVNQVPEDTVFILTGNKIETVYTPLVRALLKDWKADPQQYRGLFGSDYWQFALLMKNLDRNLNPESWRSREYAIYENLSFLNQIVDLKELGVYANYGFTHLLQDQVNDFLPLAGLLNQDPAFQGTVYSYLGLLHDCEVLAEIKYDNEGNYQGYKTTNWQDGDNWFEKQAGIQLLKKASGDLYYSLYDLSPPDSPFRQELWFVNASRGKRFWKVEEDNHTLNYFQAVVFLQNSQANAPIEEKFGEIPAKVH